MKTNPFRRAAAMFAAIAAAMQLPLDERRQALAAIPDYHSHGHGKGLVGKNYAKLGRGKTYPMNGARECERRRRQIALGRLQVTG